MKFGLPGGKHAKYSSEQRAAGLPSDVATLNLRSAVAEKKYRNRIGKRTVVLDEEFVADENCLLPEDFAIRKDLEVQLKKTLEETHLSPRKRQIAEYMWRNPDITNRTIARNLGISEAAVGAHKTSIERRLRKTATQRTNLRDFLFS